MGGGDGAGVEVGVGQPALDEGLDAQRECPGSGLAGQQVLGVQAVGQGGGDQVGQHGGQPRPVRRRGRVDFAGQAHEGVGEEPAWTFTAGEWLPADSHGERVHG
ncbi:hypothetical protein [Streptomyces sp. 8K308]|uniref:hypothetical protein n=1 Tax=Streptomyces sp. 8K308 TaxID=2530388 RepID=UPI001FB734E7|nr:hypothetical protein [Streptomyces sp. 8K308]